MSGDLNIYGGFVVGSGGGSSSGTFWGDIQGQVSNQSDLVSEFDKKVDKIEGKTLSSNDFTDKEQEKLSKLNTLFTFSLSPDRWELFNNDIYTQTVSFENIKSTDTVIADISFSDDAELATKEYECWSKITKIQINNGSIKTYYRGGPPTIVLKVKIKI